MSAAKLKREIKKLTTVSEVIAFLTVLQTKTDRKLRDIAKICINKGRNE